MAVNRSDINFVKPATVTDTSSNGGRMSYGMIANRVKFNLFPRVTKSERVNGITRYRKQYMWNKAAGNAAAYAVLAYNLIPSPAGDRFYIAKGTQTDTQTDINSGYEFVTGGALAAALTAGAQSIQVAFESNDGVINNNAKLAINSHILNSQTVANTVKSYDAVYYNGSTWITQAAPSVDQEDQYPYGTYLGSNKVFSYNTNGSLEYLTTQNNSYTGEVTGTGNGSTTVFSATLTHVPVEKSSITVHHTRGTVPYTATANDSGVITGTNIASGSINYESGAINITFTLAPDNATNITVDYTERCYTYSGNTATIKTVEQVANNYATANTYVAMCLDLGDIVTSLSNKVLASAGGSFNETNVTLNNAGTVEDTFTLTFTSGSAFTCSGVLEGAVGSGTTGGTFAPTNANVAAAYFSISSSAFSGVFITGDTVQFKTHPAAAPMWFKEVVPSDTGAFSENGLVTEYYIE
ncbi:hypothetical protein [Candidatus Magnetobacterium casense]|uniref:Capsid protein n=1 Tax=Candidatus Magnetobacterium casense TaxID=1455061 RepID=A0ABS6RU68_9BACT|nr:hypothetical protein [Candidatus Magnetobacterium casensis]MBV6340175.1 hypothetical protein [Candidatus Magnetobacterium casensis]